MGGNESVLSSSPEIEEQEAIQQIKPETTISDVISDDIYSCQQRSFNIQYEAYSKESRLKEPDDLEIDNFYVENIKRYNQQIEAVKSKNPKFLQDKMRNQHKISENEAMKISDETEHLYRRILPAVLDDINDIQALLNQNEQLPIYNKPPPAQPLSLDLSILKT